MIPPINTRRLLLLAGLVVLPAACVGPVAPTTMIDPRADRSAIGLGLDSRDFESAGAKVVQDMLESGAVNKPTVTAHPRLGSARAHDGFT
jgi:hypothetical protein